eukprot:499271-Prorocentrum_minimum.AAC.1
MKDRSGRLPSRALSALDFRSSSPSLGAAVTRGVTRGVFLWNPPPRGSIFGSEDMSSKPESVADTLGAPDPDL